MDVIARSGEGDNRQVRNKEAALGPQQTAKPTSNLPADSAMLKDGSKREEAAQKYSDKDLSDFSKLESLLDSGEISVWKDLLLSAVVKGKTDAVSFIIKYIEEQGPNSNKHKEDDKPSKQATVASLSQGDDGESLIHVAASKDFSDILKLFLNAGLGVNDQDSCGKTPLFHAVQNSAVNTCEMLVNSSADVSHVDKNGDTALSCCLSYYWSEVTTTPSNGKGTITVSASRVEKLRKDSDIVRMLIKNGCDVTIGLPLHKGAETNNQELVQLLLDAGYPTDTKNKFGCTALYIAAMRGNVEMINRLVKAGASVNTSDSSGVSPLHIASQGGHLPAVEALINSGADVEAEDSKGNTPLHLAVEKDQAAVVEMLVLAGADIESEDKAMLLSLALQNGHRVTSEFLIKANPKFLIRDEPSVHETLQKHPCLIMMAILSGFYKVPRLVPSLSSSWPADWEGTQTDIRCELAQLYISPITLKELCRIRARRCLGANCLFDADYLPIPHPLKAYLMMEKPEEGATCSGAP